MERTRLGDSDHPPCCPPPLRCATARREHPPALLGDGHGWRPGADSSPAVHGRRRDVGLGDDVRVEGRGIDHHLHHRQAPGRLQQREHPANGRPDGRRLGSSPRAVRQRR
uniref:Uncharacterized protein n=1 Tax=uncultured marine virus TaxID=186617 RepID=A0A0F7L838_9VIRU|nr:hypothetical protein [uncultured marine virus]